MQPTEFRAKLEHHLAEAIQNHERLAVTLPNRFGMSHTTFYRHCRWCPYFIEGCYKEKVK